MVNSTIPIGDKFINLKSMMSASDCEESKLYRKNQNIGEINNLHNSLRSYHTWGIITNSKLFSLEDVCT